MGAYVLAGELKAAAGDHRVAFARYEEKLRPYVAQNLALGQKLAREMMPTSRFQLWFRSQMMRMLTFLPWKDMVAKGILEPIQKAANAITLETY